MAIRIVGKMSQFWCAFPFGEKWTTYTCVLHPTEPANYTGSYTAEYRVIIAGILLKGEIKRWQ
jgi:hypothetical protein